MHGVEATNVATTVKCFDGCVEKIIWKMRAYDARFPVTNSEVVRKKPFSARSERERFLIHLNENPFHGAI